MRTEESRRLVGKPKILCVGNPAQHDDALMGRLRDSYELETVDNSVEALARLVKEPLAAAVAGK